MVILTTTTFGSQFSKNRESFNQDPLFTFQVFFFISYTFWAPFHHFVFSPLMPNHKYVSYSLHNMPRSPGRSLWSPTHTYIMYQILLKGRKRGLARATVSGRTRSPWIQRFDLAESHVFK
jgi:hypothetical protein